MHVPAHFAMSDDEVRALLAVPPVGELITWSAAHGLEATTVPFVHEPGEGWGSLRGHLARANPQWRHVDGGQAMVLLRGPDGYVSPSWYATKREHGRVVPTWDYVVAHVHGELVANDDPDHVLGVVERLTEQHEARRPDPWSVADAPADFVAAQMKAIVGVELRITRIDAKAKLSQNRSVEDVDGVVAGLRAGGDEALAGAVEAARWG